MWFFQLEGAESARVQHGWVVPAREVQPRCWEGTLFIERTVARIVIQAENSNEKEKILERRWIVLETRQEG